MDARDRLKIDIAPVKLRVESEPYVMFIRNQYLAVIDVYDIKAKREYFIIVSPVSLSVRFNELKLENGSLVDVEIWINKESTDKFAKYVVDLA